MPTAIAPLAAIWAVPASQAGSGWVNTQRRGPRGKIQVLQILELVVMQQHCSALTQTAYPQGSCCADLQHGISQPHTLSRYLRRHAIPLCNAHSSAFKADTTLSIQERIKKSTMYPNLHTHCLPYNQTWGKGSWTKEWASFCNSGEKKTANNQEPALCGEMKLPRQPVLNPHVFISFWFGLSSSLFLQDIVKFSHFSSQCPCAATLIHSCHIPPHTRLWKRREEQLPSTLYPLCKCVRVSVTKSIRSMHSWVIFVSVINVTWG